MWTSNQKMSAIVPDPKDETEAREAEDPKDETEAQEAEVEAQEAEDTVSITSPCINIHTLTWVVLLKKTYEIQMWWFYYPLFPEAFAPLRDKLFEFNYHDKRISQISQISVHISGSRLCRIVDYNFSRVIKSETECDDDESEDYVLVLKKMELKSVIPFLKDNGWTPQNAREYSYWIAIECTKI